MKERFKTSESRAWAFDWHFKGYHNVWGPTGLSGPIKFRAKRVQSLANSRVGRRGATVPRVEPVAVSGKGDSYLSTPFRITKWCVKIVQFYSVRHAGQRSFTTPSCASGAHYSSNLIATANLG